MPAPKGSYNARGFHESAARDVEIALRQALTSLRPGMFFRNVSALADEVADACNRSPGNLRRNRRYRAILEHHVSSQPGAVGLLGEETQSVGVLRAKLLEANLRAANLLRDKKRLEAYIAKHVTTVPDSREIASVRGDHAPSPALANPFRVDFECTATALDAVIAHAEIYKIDTGSGALVDLSARPGSPPVVAPHLMEAFRRWQKSAKSR